ncbi:MULTISPECIES: pantoate--beta-alanine ligase [Pacificibacter]|uniref:pantoate--beta-alanine ligase n=1 Tax=Pacificibacter TaxID=1042323 RepID=UPI001C08C4E4|nr:MULTISPECIES: pantoate--beta-alanine ligase [Pacificibacter]MBU2937656.1 pantoate--beta-alanine ligase [Pacificibacter marinus]MDO6616149.1 pantoate--beta-alanine ligase [Pacificibacter sp. 1_MG-2023]
MKICRTKAELRDAVQGFRAQNETIGLVPTMGYLHEGHMTLVRTAKAQTNRVIITIFVNPTQFGDPSDLDAYPRDEARDFALLKAEGVDAVFAPAVEEMYDPSAQTVVETEQLANMLMGALRPDHYKGVCTIVAKLFNIAQADKAFFGEKDYQQLLVIKTMVRDLDMPIEAIGVPTVREIDGLAMSSRNVRLSPEDRQAALILNKALAYGDYEASDGREAADLENDIRAFIAREPRATVQSVDVRDAASLEVPTGQITAPVVILLAATFGDVLLIDQRVCDPN